MPIYHIVLDELLVIAGYAVILRGLFARQMVQVVGFLHAVGVVHGGLFSFLTYSVCLWNMDV